MCTPGFRLLVERARRYRISAASVKQRTELFFQFFSRVLEYWNKLLTASARPRSLSGSGRFSLLLGAHEPAETPNLEVVVQNDDSADRSLSIRALSCWGVQPGPERRTPMRLV